MHRPSRAALIPYAAPEIWWLRHELMHRQVGDALALLGDACNHDKQQDAPAELGPEGAALPAGQAVRPAATTGQAEEPSAGQAPGPAQAPEPASGQAETTAGAPQPEVEPPPAVPAPARRRPTPTLAANEDVATGRDPLRLYLRRVDAAASMTREDEVARGKLIEEGEREVVAAIVASALARRLVPDLEARLARTEGGAVPSVDAPLTELEAGAKEGVLDDAEIDHVITRLTSIVSALDRGRGERSTIEAEAGMSARELRAMARAIKRSEEKVAAAKADLVEAHLRNVVWTARRYADRGVPLLDLIQEGNIGLMSAANKYDYRLGHRFATYANWWIRQAISRAFEEQSRTIRLPAHRTEALSRINRARGRLLHRLSREPTAEELAAELRVGLEVVKDILQWARSIVSLDTPIGEEQDASLGDLIPNPAAALPSAIAMAGELAKEAREQIHTLSPREQEVLSLRFGIDRNEELSLEQIGERFGVTRERIRQIEAKALSKLRHPSRAKALRSFVEGT